jgi:hypothetical protein
VPQVTVLADGEIAITFTLIRAEQLSIHNILSKFDIVDGPGKTSGKRRTSKKLFDGDNVKDFLLRLSSGRLNLNVNSQLIAMYTPHKSKNVDSFVIPEVFSAVAAAERMVAGDDVEEHERSLSRATQLRDMQRASLFMRKHAIPVITSILRDPKKDGVPLSMEEILKSLLTYMSNVRQRSAQIGGAESIWKIDILSTVPDDAALNFTVLGEELAAAEWLANLRGPEGKVLFLRLFTRLTRADWQEVRNLLPSCVFPTIHEMTATVDRLLHDNRDFLCMSRTFSGLQYDVWNALGLMIVDCLRTGESGFSNSFFLDKDGKGAIFLVNLMPDGYGTGGLSKGTNVIASHVNVAIIPAEASAAQDISAAEMKERNSGNKERGSITLGSYMGKEDWPSLHANASIMLQPADLMADTPVAKSS